MPRDNGTNKSTAAAVGGRPRLRASLLSFGVLSLASAGTYFYLSGGRYVSTDDAYLRFNKVFISSDVPGRISEVDVAENETVKQGQLLFVIDDAAYRIAVERAEGVLAATRFEIEAMHAAYRQKLANLKAAQVSADYMEREYERQLRLAAESVVSQAKLEDARRSAEVARQQATATAQDLAQSLANLGGDPNLPVDRHPRVMQAQAALDQAALDLRHTRIPAPANGDVANIGPRPGQYVTVGLPMCALVESGSLYVEANLKETELTHVEVGEPATITVDTYPGRVWHAHVTSIGAGTGSEFAVLPAENATGNWVKIVQRLPVRLRIDPQEDVTGLRAGMSVSVEIDTGQETRFWRIALP